METSNLIQRRNSIKEHINIPIRKNSNYPEGTFNILDLDYPLTKRIKSRKVNSEKKTLERNKKKKYLSTDLTSLKDRRKYHIIDYFQPIYFTSSRQSIRNTPINTANTSPRFSPKLNEIEEFVENKVDSFFNVSPPEVVNFIKENISKSFLFNALDDINLEIFIKSLSPLSLKANEFLFEEEKFCKKCFFLYKGSLLLREKGKIVKNVKVGELIGEFFLINNAISVFSALAEVDSVLFCIDQNEYSLFMIKKNEEKLNENRKFIEKVFVFEGLTYEQKGEIALNLNTVCFEKGEKIVLNEGAESSCLYIIKDGIVSMLENSNFLYFLHEGQVFGNNIVIGFHKNYTVVVHSDELHCLTITNEKIQEILGSKFSNVLLKNMLRKTLIGSKVLQDLSSVQKELLINQMEILCYYKNCCLVGKKTEKKLIIIVTGSVVEKTLDSNLYYTIGDIIGEDFLTDPSFSWKSNYYAEKDIIVAEIPLTRIEQVLCGKSFEKILIENSDNHEKQLQLLLKSPNKKLELAPENLSQILLISELGEGACGVVFLAQYQNNLYALKLISKSWIEENHSEYYIINERRIHQLINFPFIVSLHTTFKDSQSVYFLFEYVKGIDLFSLISKEKLELPLAKFYTATLILTVEYLHSFGIVHRDIKPENIVIDHEGYLKLLDLGVAKFLISKGARTYSLVGTPCYVAPEMIVNKGYSFPVDLWAIGVCLFEMVCGYLPFGENVDDPKEIYEEIVNEEVVFPKFMKNKHTRNFIRQLLSKSPEARLGGSFGALKSDKFFWIEKNNENPLEVKLPEIFPWDDLFNKNMKPLFLPHKDNFTDVEKSLVTAVSLKTLMESENMKYLKSEKNGKITIKWDEDFS